MRLAQFTKRFRKKDDECQFTKRVSSREDDTLYAGVSRGDIDNRLLLRIAKVRLLANSPYQKMRASSMMTTTTKTTTALQMVLSTPDTIIEQASTQNLLDALLDESVRTQSRHPIMLQFNPSQGWIWRQWRGTVFSETWKSCLANMLLATGVVFLYKFYPGLKDLLQGFSILWGQLLSVTTFTLTFFLNQSYGLWRKCYDYSRRLQGRLNDLGMTLAAHATRTKPSSPDIPSTYTPTSRQALELVSRYVRVFNLLTYASFTRSHRPILTPRGMRRLVERGILTSKEREILSDAEVPATQRHNAVLVWLMRIFMEGRTAGIFEGGMGFEEQFLEKCHVIRAQYGAIGDELQGRMPLAYAHIVQVLLDVVLWMYPFMALSTGMAWHISILGTGLLTVFYQGLFDLSKQFLDPYDNENYGKGDDPLVIDTLIAETNAGSVRWMNSFQQQPWNRQALIDGELTNLILPLRGYSSEYLVEKQVQEEKEKLERDLALKEKKRKEDEKDRQRAEALLQEHVTNNGTNLVIGDRLNGAVELTPAGEVLMNWNELDDLYRDKTYMEVSGGEAVKFSLLSPGSLAAIKANDDILSFDSLNVSTATKGPERILTDSGISVDLPLLLDSKNEFVDNTTQIMDEGNEYGDDDDTDDGIEDDDIFQPIQIEWFDEVGPDGKEYRLSQMLADEDWFVDDDVEIENDKDSKPMTYDEFTQQATEIIDLVNSEIAETKQIMNVSPGRDAEYDVMNRENKQLSSVSRRAVVDEPEPLYDQTKLDGISQLWGAPPGVLEQMMVDENEDQDIINDGIDFRNLYSLWGITVPLEMTSLDTEEDKTPLIPAMSGVSQLWNENTLPYREENELNDIEGNANVNSQAYAGLDWWDQVTEDGKVLRLSQILADEEYEEIIEEEDNAVTPMTIERFVEETEKLIEQAEAERKETEAILKAPPLAEFVTTDEDSSYSVASASEEAVAVSDKFEEIILSMSSDENEVDDELGLDIFRLDGFTEGETSTDDDTRI